MASGTAAVVGGGVIGLSAARALRLDGFDVTVYEQHRVGTPRGSSPGRSRIYRTSYRVDDYVRLGRRAIEEWQRVDPSLLLRNGLMEYGAGVELHAQALERCGEPYEWLEPHEAERLFPEARFTEPVLWTRDAGAVLADDALRRLREGVTVAEGTRIDDPRELEADVVVACPGSWLSRLFGLPVHAQIEQVCFFAGAPDTRPSLVDHGGPDGKFWYGLVSPGVGYKIARDGARPDPFDPDRPDRPVLDELADELSRHVAEAFPGLDPAPVHREACLYTMSPDGDFILDTIDGVVVCGGDSGHAFKFGPLLGRFCADLAQGRKLPAECARFRADRFASTPA
ncbi:MAG TPA: FAD-dependent oxidoreductase [Gaiellales bacterium]|nr:FAD-dependent oxidoreductase [Gaiellales bacterium]